MSHKQDLAFFGLLISVILHILLGYGAARLPRLTPTLDDRPTEVTFIEREKRQKGHYVGRIPEVREDVFKELKNQATYLAQLTQRVKKQSMAQRFGKETQNTPKNQSPNQKEEAIGRPEEQQRGDTVLSNPMGNYGKANIPKASIGPTTNLLIPGIEQGFITALNADRFTYFAFFNRMEEQVGNRWGTMMRSVMTQVSNEELTKLATQDRTSVYEFTLNNKGEIVKATLVSSSGFKPLDFVGSDAFKMASPFVNPPAGMLEPDGFIRLKVAFTVVFRPHFGPGAY